MEHENYYLMLELPVDPPATDPGEIRAAINRKKQEWTRWQDHPGKRALGLKGLAALADIEAVMFDAARRKAHAREALAIRGEMLRRFEAELRILEGKGHLLPREVTAIAAKYRVYGVDAQVVGKIARVPVSERPPAPKEEDIGEVIDRLTAKTVERNLGILEKPDLYAFLGEPRYSSIKKLKSAAEGKRRAASGAKTAASVATQELVGICLRLFESFDSKQLYDRYLKIARYPALGEMIDEEFTRSRFVSTGALVRLVNFAVETYGCKVLEAEAHIERYCAAYRIPLGVEKPLIPCPACKEKVERESVVCHYCAAPLRGNCPACGALFEEGPAACHACGFHIGDMVKALPYLDEAQGAIIDGNWSTALRCLAHMEKYWPGHPELPPLKKRARGLEERYSHYVEQVNECLRGCRYYAALELVEEAAQKNVRLPASTVRQIGKVTDDLEAQLAVLASEANPNIERLMELSGTVSDSLELARLLSRHPPVAPARLSAAVQGRQVRLTWSPSDSPGTPEYVLVRKQGSSPYTAYDGDILYEGPANSYTDSGAGALREFYYRVFSRRGGAFSADGAPCGPILIVPEIENLRILPADQGAQLSWAVNTDMREVRIWRKLGGERPTAPGEGVLIETTRIDGFVDTRIKNDVEYWYYLVAVYAVEGREVISRGVCEMITPYKIVAPIDRLSIVKAGYGDDEFVVNWNAEHSDVILLASPKKPDFRVGDVFPAQELLSRYRKLSLHARAADSGRFRYSFVGGVYVFAAVLFGKFATVGTPHYLTNLRDVEQVSANLSGGDLLITMRWPLGLSDIAVAHKPDAYPRSFDELGADVLHVSREQYDYDGGVLLRDLQPGAYYIKIFSLYTNPDGVRLPSDGATLLYKNLPRQEAFYRFAYKRKRMKNQAELSLTLSGPAAYTLPRAVIAVGQGRLPLSRSDGKILLRLDEETRVNGEVLFQYEIEPLPDNSYLRLFLQEDEQYGKFRLLPGSELGIKN